MERTQNTGGTQTQAVTPSIPASKPRHVPAFREVTDAAVYQFLLNFCSEDDMKAITHFYALGMIGLVRVQKDDDHVEGFISDICKRCTKLTIDKVNQQAINASANESSNSGGQLLSNSDVLGSGDGSIGGNNYSSTTTSNNTSSAQSPSSSEQFTPTSKSELNGNRSRGDWGASVTSQTPCECFSTASVGFTNRSKRWTLCPSKKCCDSAVDRLKIVGQWKILKLDIHGSKLEVPRSIRNSYDMIMDDADYFVSTLCPQQTYHSKHLPQGSQAVFDMDWHYRLRYRFPEDIVVFVDDDLNTRAVWRMKQTEGTNKYTGEGEKAEGKLLTMMMRVLQEIRAKERTCSSPLNLRKGKGTINDAVASELQMRLL